MITSDETGARRTSRFRVLTTLLDHEQCPAPEIAGLYARRWQVELAYKNIKSTLRGTGRRLRGQTPDLAEQEIWGLPCVYNAVVDQATATAVDLDVDPHEISFTIALHAVREHLAGPRACTNCAHRPTPDPNDLRTRIAQGPRTRPARQRNGPRTTTERKTRKTQKVTYTINIEPTNLPTTDKQS